MSNKNLDQHSVEAVYSEEDAARLRTLKAFSPDYFAIIEDFGLSNLWLRAGLSAREKELVVLASLITQGDCALEIQQHFFSAQKRQVSQNDILELIILLTAYIGVPRTLNAINQIHSLAEKQNES